MKVEMHLHAKDLLEELSADEIISTYRQAGYGAIVVTDIFKRRDFEKKGLNLEKFFDPFSRLFKASLQTGISVLPGAELDHGGHFLIYGLMPTQFQELTILKTFSTILSHIHGCGGIIVQAHPFRVKNELFWHQLNLNADGLEIINGSGYNDNNKLAQATADILKKIKIIGSDAHGPTSCCQNHMNIEFSDYKEFVNNLTQTKVFMSQEVIEQHTS